MSAKLERVSGWEVVNPEWACNITRDKVYFSARFRLVVWGGVYGVGPEEARVFEVRSPLFCPDELWRRAQEGGVLVCELEGCPSASRPEGEVEVVL